MRIIDIRDHVTKKLKNKDLEFEISVLIPEHYAFLKKIKKVFGVKGFLPARFLKIIEKNL